MNIRDPRVQKMILAGILVAGVFYVYFGLSVLPFGFQARRAEITQLKDEYAKLSSEVTQAKRMAADLPRVEALNRATQRKWEVAHELLPPKTDMAGFLRQMTMVGQSSGVEFVKFEPGTPANHEYYAENPVEITVVGGYHQVGSFFGEIASLSRLVNVGTLKMVGLTGGDEDETVSATFVASAYSVTGSHVRATNASASARPGAKRSTGSQTLPHLPSGKATEE